jgi:hypothetical protein
MGDQQGRAPRAGCVTVLALKAKETCVNGRLLVALAAFLWSPFENLVRMASRAIDLGMLSIQWEENYMLEIAHPIDAIMAIQTFRAILCQVAHHEFGIFLGVAVRAGLQVELVYIARVAALAGQRLPLIVFGVVDQSKTGLDCMVKRFAVQCGVFPVYG